MKTFFSQSYKADSSTEEDFSLPTIQEDLEKTRIALEIAYAGFDNATDEDMIDCYIYEINSLLKRYKHLTDLAAKEPKHTAAPSPFKALIAHVTG